MLKNLPDLSHIWLVVEKTSEKYEFVSWDHETPNIWKIEQVPKNNQTIFISEVVDFHIPNRKETASLWALCSCFAPAYEKKSCSPKKKRNSDLKWLIPWGNKSLDLFWLVVGPPLWKIWVRQLGWWDSQYFWENKKWQPNHQPVFICLSNFQPVSIWPGNPKKTLGALTLQSLTRTSSSKTKLPLLTSARCLRWNPMAQFELEKFTQIEDLKVEMQISPKTMFWEFEKALCRCVS